MFIVHRVLLVLVVDGDDAHDESRGGVRRSLKTVVELVVSHR